MRVEPSSLRSFKPVSSNAPQVIRLGLFPMGTMFAAMTLGMNGAHAQSAAEVPATRSNPFDIGQVQVIKAQAQ